MIARGWRVFFLLLVAIVTTTPVAGAHPLGNFTSNHLSRLDVSGERVMVRYVLDDAEIPAFTVLRALAPDGRPTPAHLAAWGHDQAERIAHELTLRVDGGPTPLQLIATQVALRPGAGGLQTLYLTVQYAAPLPHAAKRLAYEDRTFPGKIGWRDIVLGGEREPTDSLRRYPNALLGSPRDRTSIEAQIHDGRLVAVTRPVDVLAGALPIARMNGLSDLLGRNLADPFVLFGALLFAIALGALHALEPGHGKTLLSIALVGARASVPQAALLAGALTAAHTVGVFAFGVAMLALGSFLVPETLYPWIALATGLFVAILGGRALARVVAGGHHHQGSGAHHHDHHHHAGRDEDEAHALAHLPPRARGDAPLGFRSALLIAASGNIAPCPAALVVLLAAVATHRLGAGLVLIVAFSFGLALTLTAIGFAVVRGAARLRSLPGLDRLTRIAPLLTGTAISVAGALMVATAFAGAGIPAPPALVAALVLIAIAAYALGGHRHHSATEAAA